MATAPVFFPEHVDPVWILSDYFLPPVDPDTEIPDRERERLDYDLHRRIDAGMFDPASEVSELE